MRKKPFFIYFLEEVSLFCKRVNKLSLNNCSEFVILQNLRIPWILIFFIFFIIFYFFKIYLFIYYYYDFLFYGDGSFSSRSYGDTY